MICIGPDCATLNRRRARLRPRRLPAAFQLPGVLPQPSSSRAAEGSGLVFPGWRLQAQLSHGSCSLSLRRGKSDPGTAKDDSGRSQRMDLKRPEGQGMNSWRRMARGAGGSAAHPQVRSHRVTPSFLLLLLLLPERRRGNPCEAGRALA